MRSVAARPRSSRVWLFGVVVVAVIVAVTVEIATSGPDRTLSGVATKVEPHEICIIASGKARTCAHVDYPGLLSGVAVGDCVEIDRSGEGTLQSVQRTDGCT